MKTKHADWFRGVKGNTVYSKTQHDLKVIVTSDVEGEQESAAKLIAAAPELLEALSKLMIKYEFNLTNGQRKNLHLDDEFKAATIAIQKATE